MRATRPIRRFRIAVSAWVIVSLSFVVLANGASSQTAESFRDDFTSISYSGNNGTMNWSGAWQESGESDGPSFGSVQVTSSDRCFGGSGNCLRIGSDGGTIDNHGVSRRANLGNAVTAALSFRYRRQTQGQVPGSVAVQISRNGGSSWSTLTTISMAGPQKSSTATFDIGGYMGSDTVVRFRGSGSGITGFLHIDAIEVTADMVPPSTTTTLPTTTTIPGTPTTTAAPGIPTTTTTPSAPTTTTAPGTPTTSTPGTPTTTTAPGTPTTSTPGTPTTTTAPGTPTTTTGTATSPGTSAPSTTSPSGSNTTISDAPGEALADAGAISGESQVGSSTDDDPAPITIAVETVSANAMTVVLLALLASGLAIVGIDRKSREPEPNTGTDDAQDASAENE